MKFPHIHPRRAIVGALAAMSILTASPAAGQRSQGSQGSQGGASHNRGALTFSGGIDAASVHYFRGLRQERDPKFTTQPFGELRIGLSDQAGAPRLAVTIGVWNSLQTGSSGLEGPSKGLHYEEDFYATLSVAVGRGLELATAFEADTSPNSMFESRKEVRLAVSQTNWLHPSALVAQELSDEGQADEGDSKGTYVELGAGPGWALMAGGPTVEFPVRVGLSLKDYYEGRGGDERFGFFDVGGRLTLPLKVPERFGAWNLHGGASWLLLGDSTKARNIDKDGNITSTEILWTFGVGVIY